MPDVVLIILIHLPYYLAHLPPVTVPNVRRADKIFKRPPLAYINIITRVQKTMCVEHYNNIYDCIEE